jgi:hypothetical protein
MASLGLDGTTDLLKNPAMTQESITYPGKKMVDPGSEKLVRYRRSYDNVM